MIFYRTQHTASVGSLRDSMLASNRHVISRLEFSSFSKKMEIRYLFVQLEDFRTRLEASNIA